MNWTTPYGCAVEEFADGLKVLIDTGISTPNEVRRMLDDFNALGSVNVITPEETRGSINAFIDDEIEAVRRDPLLNWLQKRKRIKELERSKVKE